MALVRHCHETASGTGFPITVNKPTSGSAGPSPKNAAVGDLIVIFASNDGTEGTALWDDSTNKPSGFTFINESGDGTSDTHCAAFWRKVDGTEGTTFSVPAAVTHDGAVICVLYSGQDATTPINVVSADSLVGSATSLGVVGANTTVANCLACAVVSFDGGDEGGYSTSGTGWAEVLEARSGSTSADESMCLSERTVASVGATGTCTFTIGGSADGLAGFQFAIAPSSGQSLTVDPGSHELTGIAATIVADRSLAGGAATGSYSLTGFDTAFVVTRAVVAEPAAYTHTGVDASLLATRALSCDPASFVLTGIDATLEKTTPEISLTADPGTFNLTGVDASVLSDRVLTLSPESFLLTGVDATLEVKVPFIIASPGSYDLTGIDATLDVKLMYINAMPESYTLTGLPATLEAPQVTTGQRQNLSLNGSLSLRL